ncbi:MAG TPA: hypothetical protein VMF05_01130 [Stellaceae bacterium]|nr:hypothetical protein [Stellaceae bacterium]
MAQSMSLRSSVSTTRYAYGFIAAFFATLIFHQLGLLALHFARLTRGMPYDMHPVLPFGVPHFLSLAFWGGVWGIIFVLVERVIARNPLGYWIGAIIFGAIFPTAVSWFVVAPLKGLPPGYGFHYPGLLVGPIVNGLWGLGTAVFLCLAPHSVRHAQ